MTRAHIEFIQAQTLAWEAGAADALRKGLAAKYLSRDPATGAFTALLRYPPGYRSEGGEVLAADEEFYVIDGGLAIDDRLYNEDCYGFLPAGFCHRTIRSETGAVVLAFLSGNPAPRPADGHAPALKPDRAIPLIDCLAMPWDRHIHDHHLAFLGLGRKNLRQDPETGERTFLFMTAPQTYFRSGTAQGPQETHPVVEEAYVLAGDLAGDRGTMYPGAYFWRPPGIPHGPYGSRMGSLSLIRFVGGRHVNDWTDYEVSLTPHPSWRPDLPAHLKVLESRPFDPPKPF